MGKALLTQVQKDNGASAAALEVVLGDLGALSDDEVLALADRLHELIRSRRHTPTPTYSYAVVKCGEDWRVICRRGRIGRFGDAEEALAFCSRLVLEAATSGRKVECFLQDTYGELLPVDVRLLHTAAGR